jgi:hypothetical protein
MSTYFLLTISYIVWSLFLSLFFSILKRNKNIHSFIFVSILTLLCSHFMNTCIDNHPHFYLLTFKSYLSHLHIFPLLPQIHANLYENSLKKYESMQISVELCKFMPISADSLKFIQMKKKTCL